MSLRLSTTAGRQAVVLNFAYDSAGDVASTRYGGSGSGTGYTYDPAGQLLTVGGATPASYSYDLLGRRTQEVTPSGVTSYSYNSYSELTSTVSDSGSGVLFGYDRAGRRTSETGSDGSAVAYAYDPSGRLEVYTRSDSDGTGVAHERGYDTSGRLTRVVNTGTPGGGSSVSRVDWDSSPVALVTGWQTDGETLTVANTPTGPSVVKTGASNTAVNHDFLGPVYPSGLHPNASWADLYASKSRYTPYGTPKTPEPAAGVSMQPAMGYRGELTFGPLTHLRARDYDAANGVFTTRDPLEDVPGTPTVGNPYHYTNNDPLNHTDPTGMRATDGSASWDVMRHTAQWDPLDLYNTDCSAYGQQLEPACGFIAIVTTQNGISCGEFDQRAALLCQSFRDRTQKQRLDAAFTEIKSIVSQYEALIKGALTLALGGGAGLALQINEVASSINRIKNGNPSAADYIVIAASLLTLTSALKIATRSQLLKQTQTGIAHTVTPTKTPRTAGGLADAASGARLNARLAADEIASGHAYTKHVVQRGEFPGIRTRTQFADMVENVINNYDDVRHLSGGRTAYWRDGVVVIRNPRAPDGGTAYVPRDGYDYFMGLG
ncbi:MAG: RHS repeat-associated core domain-containing protein [Microthrixaceae bacterium]